MKYKKKRFSILVLALSMFLLLGSTRFNVKASERLNISAIKTLALNLARQNMDWDKSSVKQIKEVYDCNNKLIAYSIDLDNKRTSSKGYELIDSKNHTAIEFSKDTYSPYNNVKGNSKCVYAGAFNYLLNDKSGNYFDIENHSKLNKETVNNLKINASKISNSTVCRNSINLFSENKQAVKSNTSVHEKILQGVPDKRWYKGCIATAIGMVLEYDYPDDTPEFKPLVRVLSPNIGTDSNGNVDVGQNVIDGIKKTMKLFDVNNISVVLDGNGKKNSSYQKYVKEIDSNHPVVAMFDNCKIKSPGYPNGFGNHGTAGVGYKYTSSQQFLVVHTEGADGDFYVDFNSPLLGNNQWLYIHQ